MRVTETEKQKVDAASPNLKLGVLQYRRQCISNAVSVQHQVVALIQNLKPVVPGKVA